MRSLARVAGLLAGLLYAAPSPAAPPEFWPYWGDGKAELSGYQLTQPRYGELRKGTAVLVFVTEDFSEKLRVKADPGRHPESDVFPVLKLNSIKDFQTGLYDYNLLMSVFSAVEPRYGQPAGQPTKIVFSTQEWCGAMFEQLRFSEDKVSQQRFSYFDGEAEQSKALPRPKAGVSLDELPILVRSLTSVWLEPGEKKALRFLRSLEKARLLHQDLEWIEGTLERSRGRSSVSVPAGKFEVEIWTATVGSEVYRYFVEVEYPRRIIRWEGPEAEVGELLATARLPYWQLHGEGDEKLLSKLGLSVHRPLP